MSVSSVPVRTQLCLWGKAGGRCQYDGCNRPLYRDPTTKHEFNSAYLAHIIADKPNGPRGNLAKSETLKADISNLMLLCDTHHRLIDKADVAGHPVGRLQEMKKRHEDRIDLLTGLTEERQSDILLYGAKIGAHDSPLSYAKSYDAMLPAFYPASAHPFEFGLKFSAFSDAEERYWELEVEQLRRQFQDQLKPRLTDGSVKHLSVFALAPMPLLIELGRLLSDIPQARVFQRHREPADWKWREAPSEFAYQELREGDTSSKRVALILGLSATVVPDRITSVLGEDAAIWTITHESPGNDFLQSEIQLTEFRRTLRRVFNEIKAVHGEDAELHVFPAIPVAAAVEMGRVWMPKADLPFKVYDQNRRLGGFQFALEVR